MLSNNFIHPVWRWTCRHPGGLNCRLGRTRMHRPERFPRLPPPFGRSNLSAWCFSGPRKKLHFETLSEHPQDCRERTPHMTTNVTIYKFSNRANIKFSATMSVGAKSIKAREKQQMPIGIVHSTGTVKDTSDVTHCCWSVSVIETAHIRHLSVRWLILMLNSYTCRKGSIASSAHLQSTHPHSWKCHRISVVRRLSLY